MKDLNLLFAFEALWRDHSVSIAADNLGVTQGAVSSSLKRLRQEYGDRLFTVVGRRMEPTPFAVQIAPTLLEALDLVREAQSRALEFSPQHCRKVFTVRTRDIGEAVCLPTILKMLQTQAPMSRINTVASSVEETLIGLSTGRIDLAIGYLPTLKTDIHRTIVSSQHYVCALRRGHPLADAELTLERFLAQQHLLVETGGTGHVLLERADRSRRAPQHRCAHSPISLGPAPVAGVGHAVGSAQRAGQDPVEILSPATQTPAPGAAGIRHRALLA
ncbi:DNA-binding transcriptional regulator, LysR family [Pseudomonas moorei]|uniref:DNA-binding transcriptional regulator, LysR family n=1 Tax=Pseudomonas moorei TaxID=395599 RepID=A0A1H1EYN5_9PSED|nr:LysR family transcriptional regulator [Pseudomonas moorei]SDQ93865.1 DNA-binding transcriptional regulator, LysR family [Pseudomonas moorei]